MAKPINEKCLECSKHSFRGLNGLNKPECWVASKCTRKRNYYKYLDEKRAYELKYHHYNKYRSGKCCVCFSGDKLESHHIIPQKIGGQHTDNNIMTLCQSCHRIITKYYNAINGLNISV